MSKREQEHSKRRCKTKAQLKLKSYRDWTCCLNYTVLTICAIYIMEQDNSNINTYIQCFCTPGTNRSSGIHEMSTYPEHQIQSPPDRTVSPP